MTTFGELVSQLDSLLHSYTSHEQVTWLTQGCDSSVTTMTVQDSDQISVGISEIGEELIYVTVADSGSLSLAPFGRGYKGTTAVSHSTNEMVMFDPSFPKVEIKRALNQVVASLYPQLYRVKATTLTFAGAQATYELPADCDGVMEVRYNVTGGSKFWALVSRWEFHTNADTTEFPNGKALTFHEPPTQGATVRVTYRGSFDQFASDSDTLADIGLPESAVDVLLYGAAARLIRFLDPARLSLNSVENMARGQLVQVGDPGKVANQFYAMHLQRVDEERKKLLNLEPPQIHFTR